MELTSGPPETDVASRKYLRDLRRAGEFSLLVMLGLPLLYFYIGWAQSVRTTTLAVFDNYYVALAVAWILFAVVLLVAAVLGNLALFRVQRRVNICRQPVGSWLRDVVKAWLFTVGAGLIVVQVVYGAMRLSPQNWWVWAGLGLVALSVAHVILATVFYIPLFFVSVPIPEGELLQRLRELTVKAGLPIADFRELQWSKKTRQAMAAVGGIGPTRKIFISDTLLASCSHDEIVALVAHELGHQSHHHVEKRALSHAVSIVVCAYFINVLFRNDLLIPFSSGFAGAGDFANLPVLYVVFSFMMLYLNWLERGYFRRNERAADLFVWRLVPNAIPAFISGLEKLSQANLMQYGAEEQWRFSHPATAERVAAAQRYLDSIKASESTV